MASIKFANYYVIGRGEIFETKDIEAALYEFHKRNAQYGTYVGFGIKYTGCDTYSGIGLLEILVNYNKTIEYSIEYKTCSPALQELINPIEEKIYLSKHKVNAIAV